MKVEQYVMAYQVEQDRLRAMLPAGFTSLRPVLRINAEIHDDRVAHMECNTAVEHEGRRGWLNIGHWGAIPFRREGRTTHFETRFLKLSFKDTGIAGGCPAEKDDEGCWFLSGAIRLRPPEHIQVPKHYCDCSFAWQFAEDNASGVSLGKTLPAVCSEPVTVYPPQSCTPMTAAAIPCQQVLGAYTVRFER